MAKIPKCTTKSEMRYKWYPEYPENEIKQAILHFVRKVDPNANIMKRTVNKQVIVYMIEEYGLPDFATQEDYERYIQDSSIRLSDDKKDTIQSVKLEL